VVIGIMTDENFLSYKINGLKGKKFFKQFGLGKKLLGLLKHKNNQ
jgi:hypothetical protein